MIDSGLARIPRYDANRGINTLLIDKISQANADQPAKSGAIYGGVAGGMSAEADEFIRAVMADMMDQQASIPAP